MVEPRRRCYSLPLVELRKQAVGGILYVTVLSANKISRMDLKGSSTAKQPFSIIDEFMEERMDSKDMQVFVEVELEDLTRRTGVKTGPCPKWNSTFNMVLHDDTGILKFHLYECTPGSVNYVYLTSCEVKVLFFSYSTKNLLLSCMFFFLMLILNSCC